MSSKCLTRLDTYDMKTPNTARQHYQVGSEGGRTRGVGYENWAPRSRSGRVVSGLKQVQEIQCRFRENIPPPTPTATSEVNPSADPRRPDPTPRAED